MSLNAVTVTVCGVAQSVVVKSSVAVLTVVLLTIVTNKTLSPQYVLWLGGPVGALLATRPSPWLRRHITVIAVALVAVAALTQYTYPWGTYGIMALPLGSGPETSVLILRNLTLVALTGYAYGLTLKASGRTTFETPPVPGLETSP